MDREKGDATGRPPTAAQRDVLLAIARLCARGRAATLESIRDELPGGPVSLTAIRGRTDGLIRRRLVRRTGRAGVVLVGATFALRYDDGEDGERLRAALEETGDAAIDGVPDRA